MIQRSCIADKWEKERSQIDRTLLLRWVPNLFSHHREDIDFQFQYGGTFFQDWAKLFVSQGLMQAFLACLMGINDLLLLLKNISLKQRQQKWEPLPT